MLTLKWSNWRNDCEGAHFSKTMHCAGTILVVAAVLAGCHRATSVVVAGGQATLELTSTSFQDGKIPQAFTCDGSDTSPQLAWTAPPPATQSLALIVVDPDAPMGAFVHWVLYNLPATTRGLPEGVPKQEQLADGTMQGQNDFPRTGYGGPCPPRGSTHRYFFVLYALDEKLNLPSGATRAQVEDAMKGHILAHGELIARYGR
jgi:Raf kinase inhibitor-like YbhB/YbcL family protein